MKDKHLLITEREASQLTGIKLRTWQRWRSRGLTPQPIRIGNGLNPSIRYRRLDIEEWIEDGCPIVDLELARELGHIVKE